LDRPVLTGRYRDRIESCLFGAPTTFNQGGFVGRLTAAGALDPSFHRTGFFADGGLHDPQQPIHDGSGRVLALRLPQVFCGKAAGSSTPGVLSLEADGTPNPSLGNGGFQPLPDFEARGIAVDRFGRILVAGTQFSGGPGTASPRVLRLTPTGQLDRSFGTGGVARLKLADRMGIRGLALDRQGRILLAGYAAEKANFGSSEAVSRFLLVRLDRRGKLDRGFGRAGHRLVGFGNVTAFAEQVLPSAGGRVLLVGQIRGSEIASFAIALSRHLGGR